MALKNMAITSKGRRFWRSEHGSESNKMLKRGSTRVVRRAMAHSLHMAMSNPEHDTGVMVGRQKYWAW